VIYTVGGQITPRGRIGCGVLFGGFLNRSEVLFWNSSWRRKVCDARISYPAGNIVIYLPLHFPLAPTR
jgi:hypothetical protein